MSRITVAREQQKFFYLNGYIVFEGLITPSSIPTLYKKIRALQTQTPGLRPRELFRSLPELLKWIRQFHLALLAAELIDKKPIRLLTDALLERGEKPPPLSEDTIGLLLPLEGERVGDGLYFKDESPIDLDPQTPYLSLVFTTRFLNPETHPVVYK